MKIDWRRAEDALYVASVPDGAQLELELVDDGWMLYSELVDHAGISYLGDDLATAMHMTAAMMGAGYEIDGWTIDGKDQGSLVWGTTGRRVQDTGGHWWGRFLRSADPRE